MEEKVATVLQRKDGAKWWKKSYTKEMNIKIAFLFDQAIQQAALPPEQRPVSLEQVCKAAGIQMGKYDVGPYLEEMKYETEISYPQDILAIISKRKKATATGSNSSGKLEMSLLILLYHLFRVFWVVSQQSLLCILHPSHLIRLKLALLLVNELPFLSP